LHWLQDGSEVNDEEFVAVPEEGDVLGHTLVHVERDNLLRVGVQLILYSS